MRTRVVVVGDIVTDIVAVLAAPVAAGSDAPAAIRTAGGGQAANTAAWLSWLGTPVTLVGVVGRDEAGRLRLAELTTAGVTCAVRASPDAATGSVIVLADGQDRTMVTDRAANLRLTPADIDAALAGAADARHVHVSAYPLLDLATRDAGLRALAAARERGLTASVDAASAAPLRRVGPATFLDWVRGVDLLLANADEAHALTGVSDPREQARALAAVVRVAVIKLGPSGSVWAGPEEAAAVPAAPSAIVDSTGAGDAFAAGLLTAWLAGAPAQVALRAAADVGARAVATVGARPPSGPPALA